MSPFTQGHLAMLTFSACVGGSFVLGVMVANDIAPLALNFARFWMAVVVLGVLALIFGGVRRSDFAAPWRYVILGFFFATYFLMMFEGLKTAPAVNASAVFTLTPVMSAIFGYFMLRQVSTGWVLAGLAIGAAGALWVIFEGSISAILGLQVGRGEAIYFIGCISHAIYTPTVRMMHRGEKPLAFTFITVTATALWTTVLGAPDILATDWTALRPLVWGAILYIAFFATVVSSTMLIVASVRLPAANVMAYTYLVPSWVILGSLIVGLPGVSWVTGIGVALTLVALTILLYNPADRRDAAA